MWMRDRFLGGPGRPDGPSGPDIVDFEGPGGPGRPENPPDCLAFRKPIMAARSAGGYGTQYRPGRWGEGFGQTHVAKNFLRRSRTQLGEHRRSTRRQPPLPAGADGRACPRLWQGFPVPCWVQSFGSEGLPDLRGSAGGQFRSNPRESERQISSPSAFRHRVVPLAPSGQVEIFYYASLNNPGSVDLRGPRARGRLRPPRPTQTPRAPPRFCFLIS